MMSVQRHALSLLLSGLLAGCAASRIATEPLRVQAGVRGDTLELRLRNTSDKSILLRRVWAPSAWQVCATIDGENNCIDGGHVEGVPASGNAAVSPDDVVVIAAGRSLVLAGDLNWYRKQLGEGGTNHTLRVTVTFTFGDAWRPHMPALSRARSNDISLPRPATTGKAQ